MWGLLFYTPATLELKLCYLPALTDHRKARMKILLPLLLMFISLNTHAAPSRKSCAYYGEVEREYRCGTEGYPLKFGYRLCEKYRVAEPNMPVAVKAWFPKIRYCLQRYLENQRGSIRDCQDLHRKAIDSHIGCYVATGFCNLGILDQASILQVTSTDIFNADILGLSFRVKAACAMR